jgi:beta-lactamase superfamily II metal-dependent hydrolase
MKKNTVIHQLHSQGGAQMMSYVIETKDDKIIVIDGGWVHDAAYLLDYIKDLTRSDTAVIDAWLLTHIHSDHMGAIMEAFKKHTGEFVVKKLYHNFPDKETAVKYDTYDGSPEAVEFENYRKVLKPITTQYRENEIIDIGGSGGVKFEVLYTADFTVLNNFINNTSTVLKMYADGQTVMFLGDLGIEGGDILLANHPDKMRSDFVQMAHHGQNGVTFDIYKAINPKACLWDTPLWLWNNDIGKGYNTHTFQTVIVQDWMKQLGVKHHFITKDGTNRITLPYVF